jgi:hypothetical protein
MVGIGVVSFNLPTNLAFAGVGGGWQGGGSSGVTLDTTQTISGAKTFSSTVTASALTLSGATGGISNSAGDIELNDVDGTCVGNGTANDCDGSVLAQQFCLGGACSGARILDWDGALPRFQGGLKVQGGVLLIHNGQDIEFNNANGAIFNSAASTPAIVDDVDGLKIQNGTGTEADGKILTGYIVHTPTAAASLVTCDSALEGATAYDSTNNKLVVCNDSDGSFGWDAVH